MKIIMQRLVPMNAIAIATLYSTAGAVPTSFEARVDIASYDYSGQFPQLFERIPNTEEFPVNPGETMMLQPLDPSWGSPVQVSYEFVDTGHTRTITILYESIDGPFVTDAAFDRLEFPDPEFGYGIGFALGISDPDWNGGSVERSFTLSGEGEVIRTITTTSTTGGLTALSTILIDETSPAQPGFWDGSTILDRWEFSVQYSLFGTPVCPADVTGDGQIDLADLNLVLAGFGQTTPQGDTNGDGFVDLADLNAILAAFGTVCD